MKNDRRSAPRLSVSWPAKLHIKKGGDFWAIVRNISVSGLQIDTEYPLNEDDTVMLEVMGIRDGKQHLIRSILSVAYIHKEYKNGIQLNVAGLSFVQLRDSDQAFLDELLDN